jgi:hypothetical protein
MQNLVSRKESIEHQIMLKWRKAADELLDRDRGNLALRSRLSTLAKCSPSGTPSTTIDEARPVSAIEEGDKTVVSKPHRAQDDDAIDSEDKRARDVVYSRASYLIREALSTQGWCVLSSDQTSGTN